MHLKFKCDGILRPARQKYVYKCPVPPCDKKYPSRKATAKHLVDVHQVRIENLDNYCFECNAEFDDYMNHAKQHSCKFECNLCSKRFLTELKMCEHVEKFHSDTSEARPFKCNECQASFKSENHLRSHKGMRHSSAGDMKFSCDFCTRKYAFKYVLNQHMKIHLDRKFDCEFCNVSYRKLSSLKQHLKSVHGTDYVRSML